MFDGRSNLGRRQPRWHAIHVSVDTNRATSHRRAAGSAPYTLSIADRSVSTNGISRVRSSQRPAVTKSAASRVVKLTGGNEYDLSRASQPPRSPITAPPPMESTMPTSRILTNHDAGHLKAVRTALHGASEILIISGYATLPGFQFIDSEVKNCLVTGGKVKLVLGLDRTGVTSADLVNALGQLLHSYPDHFTVTLIFEQPRQEFLHAKVYWGERHGATDATVFVGSTNLTASAFHINYELSIADQGNLRHHKKKLLEFIAGLRNQKQLTPQGA